MDGVRKECIDKANFKFINKYFILKIQKREILKIKINWNKIFHFINSEKKNCRNSENSKKIILKI